MAKTTISETTKRCRVCGEEKPKTSEHYSSAGGYFLPDCKPCRRARDRTEEHARRRDKWKTDTAWREKMLAENREWHQENHDRKLANNRRWRAANPNKVREHLRRAFEKNPLRALMSMRVNYALRRLPDEASIDFVPYTVGDLRRHIERQFVDGMTWGNRGRMWELDHIVPLASFEITTTKSAAFAAAWALDNLRPLNKSLNRSKGAKLAVS